MTITTLLLFRPPASFDYLWYGYGRRVAAAAILVFSFWVIGERLIPNVLRSRVLQSMMLGIIVVIYLPALIQPQWGIINLGDASHQVFEEISGPLVGHFPGMNFVSTYTTLLGIPLLVIRPLPLSSAARMFLVDGWVNLLVLSVPGLLIILCRKVSVTRSWVFSSILVVPPLLVSGKWGAASSNTESLSMIPGRTLLPVGLGLLVATLLPDRERFKVFLIGALSVIVAFNNVEFGAPAALAAGLVVIIFHLRTRTRIRYWLTFAGGLSASAFLLVFFSLLVAGKYDVWFRIGSYAGKPYSPAEVFPTWSTHNLILGVFATAILVGSVCLFRTSRAAIAAIYFGVWGLAAFPYCSYRCLEGMYMATQVYLIPAIGAVIGIAGCIQGARTTTDSQSSGRTHTPMSLIIIGAIALACVIQAPQPRDEWRRVVSRIESAPWASDSRRGVPSEWSTNKIDWLNPQEVKFAASQVDSRSLGYFGYMGNSVQLATGINNLTRINSSEVLQIKGTQKLRELACREVDEVQPEYVLLVGMEFPCQGYEVVQFDNIAPSVQVLRRQVG